MEIVKTIRNILLIVIVLLVLNNYCYGLANVGQDVELQEDYLKATASIEEQCIQKCTDENRTDHSDTNCGPDCYITQCALGCKSWEQALESTCHKICNKTDTESLEPREMYCVIGCNDALSRYFKWLKAEIGTPPAPVLVADSLTATSLSLEWEVPDKLSFLFRQKLNAPQSYLVQWRYEEMVGDWKFCRNQSMGDNSTVRVENLQPYTKYRFRVALILSSTHDEVLVSEQSVIISTLAMGRPSSEPEIVRAVAVDHTRISISWEPGPFPNGPILSYVLQITDLEPSGYTALKDIPESDQSKFYVFEKLPPAHNFSVRLKMRNAEGEGPDAHVYVNTPPQPASLGIEVQPTLILTTEHAILTQAPNFLLQQPSVFYKSNNSKITGTALHIKKKLIFISDEDGYIYRAPLGIPNEKPVSVMTPEGGFNFKPSLLSIDWLNNHLYILGEAMNTNSWQISRCDLNGSLMTIAIAGLNKQPNHIEVDPFNGYLFWVVTGRTSDTGLFRLDLGDISNGVKHEDRPLHLIEGRNLGAFTVDHAKFRILVPAQDENTVLSVSLDGKAEDNVRKNMQAARFQTVKSLTMAHNLFYWTDGSEVISEEYHRGKDAYYHNAYLANNNYVAISVDLQSSQPIPIPVNPPNKLQALTSTTKAKISWQVPFLLRNKGKGAWQEWCYVLEISEESAVRTNATKYHNITGTQLTINDLKPNTTYKIRTAAYTEAGNGPWCTEFITKTLKTPHERYLIWSSKTGILQTDVIGENVQMLISDNEIGDIRDIAWFEDSLYIVSNSSIHIYNRTNNQMKQLRELDSVESVAIDWIGRKLYWSRTTTQMIENSDLSGEHREGKFLTSHGVREIKIDAVKGYIYCATVHTLEAFRLNGRGNIKYYNGNDVNSRNWKSFYEHLIIGTTLDFDNNKIYWIIRKNGDYSLMSAPLAPVFGEISTETVILKDRNHVQGPLMHFSDRLVWLQDNNVILGDMNGKNIAYIRDTKLNGSRAITVIDPTHHIYPGNDKTVNVIPDAVNLESIKIGGGISKNFTVKWSPVANVNYGQVYYKVIIKTPDHDLNKEVTENYVRMTSTMAKPIPPYTKLDVTVTAYTVYGSSTPTKTILYSPEGKPSKPLNPRVYINHYEDPLKKLNIKGTFRWSPPNPSNGLIRRYKVIYYHEFEHVRRDQMTVFVENATEIIIPNLVPDATYTFSVLAIAQRDGIPSEKREISTDFEHPVPQVLVSTNEQILKIDFDLNKVTPIISTGVSVTFIAYLMRENKIFWIDDGRDLFVHNGTGKTKLMTINADEIHSFALDWIERKLYWTQSEGTKNALFAYDLNQDLKIGANLFNRTNVMKNLVISPMDRKLFWIEDNILHSCNLGNREIEEKIAENIVNDNLALITSNNDGAQLFWRENSNEFKFYDINELNLTIYPMNYDEIMKNLQVDSGYLYWIGNGGVHLKSHQNEDIQSMPFSGAKTLLAFHHQNYPDLSCLIAANEEYEVLEINKTEHSLTIQLPESIVPENCSIKPTGINYTILYKEEQTNIIHKMSTFNRVKIIEGLKPFTKYIFQIRLDNFYMEEGGIKSKFGPHVVFSTSPGAPSKPENVTAIPISPSEAIVSWMPPKTFNSNNISYEVHWETEIAKGLKNKQQQKVTNYDQINKFSLIKMNLTTLQPHQKYKIWIKAFSSVDMFSESDFVEIQTFPEPQAILLKRANSTSLEIVWMPHENITKYKIQYERPNKTSVTISDSESHAHSTGIFTVINLSPKTLYRFSISLYYPNGEMAYTWPPDNRFTFETLADKPGTPGRPIVSHVKADVYKIEWSPANDNGATIEEYALERMLSKTFSDRVIRSTPGGNETISHEEENEIEDTEGEWILIYNGTLTQYIIKDLKPINEYSFRVRARNSFGWSAYSSESAPVSEPFIAVSNIHYIYMIIGCLIVLSMSLLVLKCFISTCHRNEKDKKYFNEATTNRIPDVELANLRDSPRRGNFIHSNNILYSSGPLTDSEIALLPQIRRDQITMTDFLGSGAFGEVYEGIVKGVEGEVQTRVAIKTLRKGATEQEKGEFLQEAHLMSNFKHEHILKLIGICLDHDSLYIIMELMQGGDLLSYLRQSRPIIGTPSALTLLDLISMCVDVATGCRYLEEMHFVHRDLACRNCLVSSVDPSERVVKIGDFGLARDIYKNDYYRKEGEGLLPVRWMSPESLVDGVFTSQSDIWAFGVLLWEIMTLGQQPYPARNNVEVLHYVRDGGRLTRPTDCPDELYQLMLKCWSYCPEDRPTFRYCLEVLKCLKEQTSESIQIKAQFPNKTHPDTFKFSSNSGSGNQFIFAQPPSSSELTPKSISVTLPTYLDLICGDSETSTGEEISLPMTPPPPINQMTDNGYEIPISDILRNNSNSNNISNSTSNCKGRTFSSSSTISNLSVMPITSSTINSNGNNDCSSMEALLPINQSLTVNYLNNNLDLAGQNNSNVDDCSSFRPNDECKTMM